MDQNQADNLNSGWLSEKEEEEILSLHCDYLGKKINKILTGKVGEQVNREEF